MMMTEIALKLKAIKIIIKQNDRANKIARIIRHPFVFVAGYIYGCYLTIRFVDYHSRFPAINFRTGIIKLGIKKGFGACLRINSTLIIEPLSFRRTPSSIVLGDCSNVTFDGDFWIGDDVQIVAHDGASIHISGKHVESASGISAKCLIHARKKITIGTDAIIAQDTLITDSDWHPIKNSPTQKDVIIGDHVWVANGVRILKGTTIGSNSIVGCGSVVAGKEFPDRCLITGIPGKITKKNIESWSRE